MPDKDSSQTGKPTCFVVQGFGKKTDFQTGRVLDLDASYDVIREAVEAAGFECIRADEIQHAGNIEVPMYEQILGADLVIADLSTSNVNAAYELGVRHALRRRTTIIVAEEQFSFPFDVSHIAIRTYEHLGSDLGRQEAKRFSADLTAAIKEVTAGGKTDSPVYTFLPDLAPPRPADEKGMANAPPDHENQGATMEQPASVKTLMDQAKVSMDASDFETAKALLTGLEHLLPHDDYVKQQLALATYKGKSPTEIEALDAAKAILEKLTPSASHDAETLGLWGAVHKRLWEETDEREQLDLAIAAYDRGFVLQRSYYNGINVAFLLNVRASLGEAADAIADFVLANRVREQVMGIAQEALEAGVEEDERYWVLATLREAAVGLGDRSAADGFTAEAEKAATATWMIPSTDEQIEKLEKLLEDSPLRHIASGL